MKATRKILPNRAPFNLVIDKFGTLDLSTQKTSISHTNFSQLVNLFKEDRRLVSRKGSSSFTATSEFNHHNRNATEWVHRVSDSNLSMMTTVLFGDVVLCGSKAYILGSPNTVKEVAAGGGITTRKMGISAPKMASVSDSANVGIDWGYYVWGFEFVQKDGSVVVRRSGVRRVLRGDNGLTDRPTDIYKRNTTGHVYWTISTNFADGTALSSDTSWTHFRMYRSKMITDNSNIDTGIGSASELYLIKEITRSLLISGGYNVTDNTPDVDIDDSTIVLIDGIDLVPLPAASIGCIANGRIILAGSELTAADKSATRLIMSNAVGSAYDEVYAPLTKYLDCSTDGSPIQALFSIGDDIIVMKPNETGIVRGGKFENGYQVIDSNLGVRRFTLSNNGVPVFSRYVEGVGVFAVNSDGVLRVFNTSLGWSKFIGGFDFSSPVSRIISDIYFENDSNKYFEIKYHNGVVYFNMYARSSPLNSINDRYYAEDDSFSPGYYFPYSLIPCLDLRGAPYWTSVQFPNIAVCEHMFKDHNDRLYIANQFGILDISQYPGGNVSVDVLPSHYVDLGDGVDQRDEWPIITLMETGSLVNNEGFYEVRGFNLRGSIDMDGGIRFNHSGINPELESDVKVSDVSYNDDSADGLEIKNIASAISGAGRLFSLLIHSNSNLQIETISIDGIQQDRVRQDFDPFNKNQDILDSLCMHDQSFWMSRPNPLKSNSLRAKPIVEVEIV